LPRTHGMWRRWLPLASFAACVRQRRHIQAGLGLASAASTSAVRSRWLSLSGVVFFTYMTRMACRRASSISSSASSAASAAALRFPQLAASMFSASYLAPRLYARQAHLGWMADGTGSAPAPGGARTACLCNLSGLAWWHDKIAKA